MNVILFLEVTNAVDNFDYRCRWLIAVNILLQKDLDGRVWLRCILAQGCCHARSSVLYFVFNAAHVFARNCQLGHGYGLHCLYLLQSHAYNIPWR